MTRKDDRKQDQPLKELTLEDLASVTGGAAAGEDLGIGKYSETKYDQREGRSPQIMMGLG